MNLIKTSTRIHPLTYMDAHASQLGSPGPCASGEIRGLIDFMGNYF